jgi:hypothetical protein
MIETARGRTASRRIPFTVGMLAPRRLHQDGGDGRIMSKKDGASKRLAKAIAMAKSLEKPPPAKPYVGLLSASLRQPLPAELRLDERDNAALTHFILDAFKAFDFDHRVLINWRVLLGLLASIHFGKRASGGRPRDWSEERLYQLRADFALIKNAHPGKPDTDLCKMLLKKDEQGKFGKRRYAGMTAGTIRRKLQDARRPLYCVCATAEEGHEAVERYLAEHPHYQNRTVHTIVTGVPRHGGARVQPPLTKRGRG